MSDIHWTGKTRNWQSGCDHAGPECEHCYAEAMSRRMPLLGDSASHQVYAGAVGNDGRWTGEIKADLDLLHRHFDVGPGLFDRRSL